MELSVHTPLSGIAEDEEIEHARLRDVAEQAGVSVGSASNALGRPELVSDEVRERVFAAAKALGYTGPDPSARGLRLWDGRAHSA